MACPVCGSDPTSISPADAVVALRSLPRRYREAAGPAGDEPDRDGPGDDDAVPGHRDGEAADRRALVLAQATQATAAIAALGEDLRRVLITDDPALTTTDDTATSAGGGSDGADADAVLARLKEVTDRVADLVEDQPATAWKRVGHRADGPRSALALLGEAVHAGVHHLRLAQQAVGRD